MDKKLTNSLIRHIFSYLGHNDVLKTRLVCKRFNTVAQEILNNALFDMNDRLTNLLEDLNLKLQSRSVSQNVLRYFKITNYLRSEINLIITISFVYMKEGLYSFGGGCILDFYNRFLNLSYKDIENNFEYITIYHMIESFLNDFDDKIEPQIIRRHREYQNTWFGMKLINLLDCSLDLNYKIELSSGANDTVLLDSKYNGEELHILENIPIQKELRTDAEKRSFIQVIRNNIRWNNLLYCIERPTGELSKSSLTPGLHTQHRNSLTYEKAVTKRWKEDQAGVYYKVNIKCHKAFLPLRANSILAQSSESLASNLRWSVGQMVNEPKPEDMMFELNLTMKIRSRDDDGEMSEKTVKLLNVGNTCVISENLRRNSFDS